MADFRRIKLQVLDVLKAPDWEKGLEPLLDIPSRKIICPLFSLLLYPPEIKWHAVTAFGVVVPREPPNPMLTLCILSKAIYAVYLTKG